MWWIGLDVHDRYFAICILDEHGKVIKETKLHCGLKELVAYLKGLPKPWSICYEVSCGYGHLFDLLAPWAKRVAVAHAGQLRLIFKSKRKCDRVDARKLATLLFLDQVPTVHVPSVNVRSWRNLIAFRHRQVRRRTGVKNALRTLLRSYGIESPKGSRLWSRKGRFLVSNVVFPAATAALQRDLLLDELQHVEQGIHRAQKVLDAIARKHPGVMLLQTIPGVGPRTAEAVVAWIDDARRFVRNKAIGNYFGLIPCQDQSARKNRLGHITAEGPAVVRALLTEAAWQGIRHSAHMKEYFERICRQDDDRRKIALIATAHYLARVMLAMLQSGQVWRYETKGSKQQAAEPKAA